MEHNKMTDPEDQGNFCCMFTSTPERSHAFPQRSLGNYAFSASSPIAPPPLSQTLFNSPYHKTITSSQNKMFALPHPMLGSENIPAQLCSRPFWMTFPSEELYSDQKVYSTTPKDKSPLREICGNKSHIDDMKTPVVYHHKTSHISPSSSSVSDDYISSSKACKIERRQPNDPRGLNVVRIAKPYMPDALSSGCLQSRKLMPGKSSLTDNIQKYNGDMYQNEAIPSTLRQRRLYNDHTVNYTMKNVRPSHMHTQFQSNQHTEDYPVGAERATHKGVFQSGRCCVTNLPGPTAPLQCYNAFECEPAQGCLEGGFKYSDFLNTSSYLQRPTNSSSLKYPCETIPHSSAHKKETAKHVATCESKPQHEFPLKGSNVSAWEANLTTSNSVEQRSVCPVAHTKRYSLAISNESTDSGFDSISHSLDSFLKSQDECFSSEETSLDILLSREISAITEGSDHKRCATDEFLKDHGSGANTKLTRKPDVPKRSASPSDPQFRGVMLKMRTEVQENDRVQLSIKAFFNCRKSSRQMKKCQEQDKLQAQTESTSSSDSDCPVELFHKKRRLHTPGKQCASCRTKTTPLWRDAEDGTPLCNACGIRYKKYRIRCLSCWHIPRKETKANLRCTNCGESFKLSFFKNKQWKC